MDLRECVTQRDVTRALEELRGATKIVFPAGLPPHDPVRMELDNVEDLTGTQAAKEVMDPSRACLWACGKKFINGNKLSDHLGARFAAKVFMATPAFIMIVINRLLHCIFVLLHF